MAETEIERRTVVSDAEIEYREVENGEKRPVIVGYAAVFNSESRNLGGFVETVHPEAFNDVLATNPDVLGVFNHDKNMLLGRTANGRLKLSPDSYGLRYEITPNPNTSVGRDVIEWVKDRTIVGSSFAFAVRKVGGDVWNTGNDGVRRREIRSISLLDDVGPVTRPAYEASSVVVSRRAIEMALGDSYRPNQTMANAARKGLRSANGRDDVDQVLVSLAERVVNREILSVEEVAYLSEVHKRCHEVRSYGWSGNPAWVEWMLAGGDSGERWVQKRHSEPVTVTVNEPAKQVVVEPRAEPGELVIGDFASWGYGYGMIEHIMPSGSVQGMDATPEDPLVILTVFDEDGEPEDEMVAKYNSELMKIESPLIGMRSVETRAVSLVPSGSMASAARRGLRLHEQGKSGDGLKPETVARANKIAAREALTEDHVREMNAWFARHEKASKSPGWNTPGAEKPGFVAWLLWGGNAAQRWSAMKVEQMDKQSMRSAVADTEPLVVDVPQVEQQPAVVAEAPAVQEPLDPLADVKLKIAELNGAILRTRLQEVG